MKAASSSRVIRTDETEQVELDLSERGNDNTKYNDADISKHLHVGRGNTESPGGEQSHDSIGGLEHLDERDRQV